MECKGMFEFTIKLNSIATEVEYIELCGEENSPVARFCEQLSGGLLTHEAGIDLSPSHICFYWPGRKELSRVECTLSDNQGRLLQLFLAKLETCGKAFEYLDSRGVRIQPYKQELTKIHQFSQKSS